MIPPPFAGTEKGEQKQQTQTIAQEAQKQKAKEANVRVVAFGLKTAKREKLCWVGGTG